MPYVDIVSKDDYCCLFYRTNARYNNVGSFDPEKPTVILLHAYCLGSEWLLSRFDHVELRTGYNLIAFDQRCCGRTENRISERHDSWVDAADVAFACKYLNLPPAHVFAEESLAVSCALRLAALFPSLVLSLTLCNVPPPTPLQRSLDATDEMLRNWCTAEDIESYEQAAQDFIDNASSSQIDPDLKDDLVEWLECQYPPNYRTRLVEHLNVQLNMSPLSDNELASITQPVLIIQAEWCKTSPFKSAEELKNKLINAKHGAKVLMVKSACGFMSLFPNNWSITCRTFARFLSQLPHAPSSLDLPLGYVADFMRDALERLAGFAGNPAIARRDPLSPMSFSRVSRETQAAQERTLRTYAQGMRDAYSPLGQDGKPIRRYRDRVRDHWFHAEDNGESYASPGGAIFSSIEGRRPSEPLIGEASMPMNNTSIQSGSRELVGAGRSAQGSGHMSTAEKVVVKGTMRKIVSSTAASMAAPGLFH